MGLIDLHTHTNFSDGTDSPKELINKALKLQIEVLSITDHNTVSAYKELDRDYLENHKIKLINGVELSACYNNLLVEIIGYGFDLDKMQNFIKSNYDQKEILRQERENFLKTKVKLQELGFKIDPGLQFKPPFSTEAFYGELWKHPENWHRFPAKLRKYPELLYRYLSDPLSDFYTFDVFFPSCDFIINGIHKAGGQAFLAHPYVYFVEDPGLLVEEMVETTNLDGIEVFHPLHAQCHLDNLKDIAVRKKLLLSGGSDYHGKNKRKLNLGIGYGGLKVPRNQLDWINQLIK